MTESDADPDAYARALAAQASGDDPTAWFEQLYAAAAGGGAEIPWDRGTAHPLLVDWAEHAPIGGHGRAMVVGSGPGFDAEYVSAHGFDTVAFDVSATAVELARRRHLDSRVDYQVADLLALPAVWHGGFDLVIETFTVQSMPVRLHDDAIDAVSALVAPGGTLVVIASARDDETEPHDGPPWPLSPAEIERFSSGPLAVERVELHPVPQNPGYRGWLAVFTRPHV